MLFSQDAGRARDEGEQALELAERVRVNAEGQRAESEGMFLVVQEKERQLAQVSYSTDINTLSNRQLMQIKMSTRICCLDTYHQNLRTNIIFIFM